MELQNILSEKCKSNTEPWRSHGRQRVISRFPLRPRVPVFRAAHRGSRGQLSAPLALAAKECWRDSN